MSLVKKMFTVDVNNTARAGALFVPDDHDTNTEKCALLIFNHGAGESGNGTLSTLGSETGTGSGVFANGSPIYIATQRGSMVFINPVDNKSYRYIVLALQGVTGWCCSAAQVSFVVKGLLASHNIDPNMVFITGLSAGGETTWEAMGGPDYNLYSGAAPMSTPAINSTIVDWNRILTNDPRFWVFHGKSDSGQTDYFNSVRLVDTVNGKNPKTAYLTSYNGGHCCWATYYSPNYKETFTFNWTGSGVVGKSLNLYELLLAFKRGTNFLFDNAPVPPLPPTTTKVNLTAFISNNSASFEPSGTTGVTSWDLKLVDAATGAYYKPDWSATTNGSSTPTTLPKATNIKIGNWKAVFTVQPGGLVATQPVNIGVVPIPPVIKTVYISVSLSDGKKFTVYTDDSYELK